MAGNDKKIKYRQGTNSKLMMHREMYHFVVNVNFICIYFF